MKKIRMTTIKGGGGFIAKYYVTEKGIFKEYFYFKDFNNSNKEAE